MQRNVIQWSFVLALVVGSGLVQFAQAQTLTPSVANDLLEAYELLEEEKNAEALAALNRLMERRGDRMSDFDKASVLQIRGSAYVNEENFQAALNDFEVAIGLGALPEEQQNRLRFNMAQLYFVTEQYEKSIQFFEEWLALDPEVSANTYFMLAGANYQINRYPESLEAISQAIELAEEPERRFYELKNVLLSELQMVPERTELLEEMVSIWPDVLGFWRQLSSMYLQQNQELNAFGALESAYLAGLIEDGNDILILAQFYSSFNNPYRGARLIEREMEAGRVERTVDNLELLSQLWSQSREHRQAIPILREAAQLSDTGNLFFRLGQAYLATEDNEAAASAFERALDKGGLEDNQAEAWMLLGNALFNQAGPGDRQQRRLADQAFAEAERFPSTRAQARDWRGYIRAIDSTETRQAMLEQEQSERLEAAAEERFLTGCRAQQLAGTTLSEACRAALEAARDAEEAEFQTP
ncbi:MAG: tetratricopeptide repeat protein [Wenzhouxiangella sp.]|nr:tetratricopeptide repeat protein [Wenzhouxiangella sp.]